MAVLPYMHRAPNKRREQTLPARLTPIAAITTNAITMMSAKITHLAATISLVRTTPGAITIPDVLIRRVEFLLKIMTIFCYSAHHSKSKNSVSRETTSLCRLLSLLKISPLSCCRLSKFLRFATIYIYLQLLT